jgi:hypothetical protein
LMWLDPYLIWMQTMPAFAEAAHEK